MRKPTRRTIRIMTIIGVIAAVPLGLLALREAVLWMATYPERFVEVPPDKSIPLIENHWGIDFPTDIDNVKTAEALSRDGGMLVLIRFDAKADVVDEFLKSLPNGIRILSEPYDPAYDTRASGRWPGRPKWFTEPIQKGTVSIIRPIFREVYIDTTNKNRSVVYLGSFYEH